MTEAQVDSVLGRLWPTDFPTPRTELYLLLDGARDPRIHAWLGSSTLDYRCLYAGPLPRVLAEVAPYLVHIQAHAPATRRLLSDGWGQSWGVWLHAAASLDELRRHFRRFLRVEDPDGRRLLFRYYDPRVLRSYLPTCTAEELATVFGPVHRFCIESADGATVLEYRRESHRLVGRAISDTPPR